MPVCRQCSTPLDETNWFAYYRKARSYICKECLRLKNRVWYSAHATEVNARRKQRGRPKRKYGRQHFLDAKKYRWRLRAKVLAAYGGECACCGEKRPRFLTIDHINGDGGTYRRKRPYGSSIHLLSQLHRQGYPKGAHQVLCFNCNCAKGSWGSCPHEDERLGVAEKITVACAL